jgi:hypothetical protein
VRPRCKRMRPSRRTQVDLETRAARANGWRRPKRPSFRARVSRGKWRFLAEMSL